MKRHLLHWSFGCAAGLILLAACSGPAPAPTAAPAPTKAPAGSGPTAPPIAPTAAPAAAPTKAPAAAPTKAPAPPVSLGKISVTQAGESIIFGAANIARVENLYKDEGLDAEVIVVEAGSKAMAAVVGGSAQFQVGNWGDGLNAVVGGQQIVALMTINNDHPYNAVMRKDVAKERGITYQSSREDKIKALKGLKIGVTAPGGGTEQFARYLLKSANLDPDRDAELVSLGSSGLVAGLAGKQVDAFVFPSPVTEMSVDRGDAIWLFQGPAGDFKELSPFPQNALMATKDYIQKNPKVVRAVVRTLVSGFKLMKDSPSKGEEITKKLFPSVDAKLFAESWKVNMPAFRDPEITQAGVDANIRLLRALGKKIPDLTLAQVYDGTFVQEAKRDLAFK